MKPALIALIVCAATTVTACGREPAQNADGITTLTILNQPGGWHPRVGTDTKLLVDLPLVDWDTGGGLRPRLAESWEHSDDYREWTVHLRRSTFAHRLRCGLIEPHQNQTL